MSVNLRKLDLSLDQFNAVANGKYNIGQIKLNQDGTGVYRTNNHKTWTIFNTTKISQEEAVAVKEAFCNAVAKEAHLDDAAVSALKEKLGIGSGKFESMKAGTMKALTAAEVREVIDKYAGKINESRGADGVKLATSADLYRGASEKTLASRAQTREKINAQTFEKNASEADRSVNVILDFMEYEGGDSITPEMKKFAKGIYKNAWPLTKSGEAFKLKDPPVALGLKEDMTFRAVVTLENGLKFSVDLGLTKEQLLEKAGGIMEFLAVDEKAPEVEPKTSKRPYDPIADSAPMPEDEIAEKRTKALDSLRDAFDKLKTIDTSKNPDALRNFNEDNLDDAVETLQNALVAVRGHDPRNAVIVNAVRDAFHQDPHGVGEQSAGNDAQVDKNALYDKLYDQISEVLNRERTNLSDEIDKNIEEQGKIRADKQPNLLEGEDDDGLEPLNINQLTGYTDKNGELTDKF